MAKRNSLFVLIAGLLLAACQTTQTPTPAATTTAVAPVEAPNVGVLGAERLPQRQVVPQMVVNSDPTQVVGMLPRELRSLLGRPEFVRRDMTAEVWQYRRDRCVVDLFLYDDGAGTDQRVVHYDVRPLRHDASGLSENAQRGCFAQLLRSGNAA